MTRTLLCLALLGHVAVAAPLRTRTASASPELADAERLWRAAAAEKAAGKQEAAWEAAAEAFGAVADTAKSPADRRDAAYAAVLAWENAIDVVPPRLAAPTKAVDVDVKPRPIPDRDQRILRAFERYTAIDPASDEAVGMTFRRARILYRFEHLDEAIPLFDEIVRTHPRHEAAEYAANLELDAYNRLQRFPELIALAERLRADKAFLAGREDLATTVARIHGASLRRELEELERAGRDDPSAFERCGEGYAALAKETQPDERDEVLYNAMVCFGQGGAVARGIAAGNELLAGKTRSRLRARALARVAMMEGQIANVARAATLLEQYVADYGGEADAGDAASNAVLYRFALGDLDAVERDLASAAKLRKARELGPAQWHLVDRLLLAGRRADARRIAAGAAVPGSPWQRMGAVRTMLDAACPVALADGLCPRPRDQALERRARGELHALVYEQDLGDVAKRLLLDLDVDVAARRDAELAGYRDLIASKDAETRAAVRARLARLDRSERAAQLAACVDAARDGFQHAWLVACERELAVDPPRERVAAPVWAAPALDVAGASPRELLAGRGD